jgi:hypothetical protein
MARREAIGPELARNGQEVGELHPLVAGDAGDRSPPPHIFVGEAVDHAVPEAAFIVEHIMGDAEPVRDRPRIVDVLTRAAAPGPLHRGAMIVKLERHADHFRARPRGERGHDRAVDAARHGDDDPGLACRPVELKACFHRRRT